MLRRLSCPAALLFCLGAISAFFMSVNLLDPALAIQRIASDRGGRIGSYLTKFTDLRKSGEQVVIDGTCASACTLVIGIVPRNRICVTARAVLAFHAAWDLTLYGAQVNKPGTRYLWSHYPADIREWIARHGGLRAQTIYLGGRELAARFPTCR